MNTIKKTTSRGNRFPCHIYEIPDAYKAYDEIKVGWAKEYGDNVSLEDGTVLHWNYVWDDGKRFLIRCKACGGLLLIQCSEFHSFTDDPDGYYEDWIPVSSVEESDLLNILYGPWELDNCDIRHILHNNGKLHWRDGPAPFPYDLDKLRKEIRKKYSKLNKKQKEMLEELISEAGKEEKNADLGGHENDPK